MTVEDLKKPFVIAVPGTMTTAFLDRPTAVAGRVPV